MLSHDDSMPCRPMLMPMYLSVKRYPRVVEDSISQLCLFPFLREV